MSDNNTSQNTVQDTTQHTDQPTTLYYVHDPMCSWCWGFRPVWQQVQTALQGKLEIVTLLGGLAADTDEPMSAAMQASIRNNWQRIQQEIPATQFNYDFWSVCKPRRSTYPACRAIIACRMQQPALEPEMLLSIQRAYYLQAKNPSDVNTLVALAEQTGLNKDRFRRDIASEECETLLQNELQQCKNANIYSFPSLLLKQGKSYTLLDIDYTSSAAILNQIV